MSASESRLANSRHHAVVVVAALAGAEGLQLRDGVRRGCRERRQIGPPPVASLPWQSMHAGMASAFVAVAPELAAALRAVGLRGLARGSRPARRSAGERRRFPRRSAPWRAPISGARARAVAIVEELLGEVLGRQAGEAR